MGTFFVRCFLVFNINQIIAIELKRTRLIFHFERSLRSRRRSPVLGFTSSSTSVCRQVLVFSSTSKFNVSTSFLDFSFCPLNRLDCVRHQRVLPVLCEFLCCLYSRSLSYFSPRLPMFDHCYKTQTNQLDSPIFESCMRKFKS